MLPLLLLLQGLSGALVPTPVAVPAPDEVFAASARALAAEPSWTWERLEAMHARTPAQEAALAAWCATADAAQLRLIAVLGAGCDGPLQHSLFVIGTRTSDEALGVACLLSPAAPPAAWWPALAAVAVRTAAPLPVRAAAAARLLEADCAGAWPLARSILRTGTARDEAAPWADWQRGGRYELPKRLLVGALDACCAKRGQERCGFEPNAAWAAQERALEAFEARIGAVLPGAPAGAVAGLEPWQALLRAAAQGNAEAQEALVVLGAAADELVRTAADSPDAATRAAARRAVAERGR